VPIRRSAKTLMREMILHERFYVIL